MKISAQEEHGMRTPAPRKRRAVRSRCRSGGSGRAFGAVRRQVDGRAAQAGILDSVRGRSGGYRLAKSPEEIGLGSLLLILGEPLFDEVDYCQKHAGTEAPNGVCMNKGSCTLKNLWQSLEHFMRHMLDQVTLADLIQDEHRITELLRERLAVVDESPLLSLNVISR